MTQKNTIAEISIMPKLAPMYTEDGVRIQGIGRTKEVTYGVIAGKLTRIEAGERLTLSGSMGMDYLGVWSFGAQRVTMLSSGQQVVYRERR